MAVALLGTATGLLTGLAPGLHVNNLAAVVLATKASWLQVLVVLLPAAAVDASTRNLLLACYLLAAALSHVVVGFVPSVFLGAPTEETALALLPGHRLLLRGQGPRAVALAARGAVLGMILSVLLLLPLRWVLCDPVGLAAAFRPWAPVFLAALLAALALSEVRFARRRLRRLAAVLWVQLLAGALGLAVLRGPAFVEEGMALFPLFSGLFGFPNLLLSLRSAPGSIPPQRPARMAAMTRFEFGESLRGAVAGAAISWLPGLSGGAAASLAAVGSRRRLSPSAFMVVLGAVATSTTVLSVAVLFMIGRTRSGAAVAIREILGAPGGWADPWGVPGDLAALVLCASVAVACAAPMAVVLARLLARRWSRLDQRKLSGATLLGLGVLLVLATGPVGLALAALSAAVGAVPLRLGVRRVQLMAALLVPVLVGYLAP